MSAAASTLVPLIVATACAVPAPEPPAGPVAFDTAVVWVVQGSDSASLRVEIARSERQQEVGLSGRRTLDRDFGMMFLFDAPRTEDDGFWMWETHVPLDVAFLDGAGIVRDIVAMEPCAPPTLEDDCPGYFPDVGYESALEVASGWFAREGLGEGARVTLVR